MEQQISGVTNQHGDEILHPSLREDDRSILLPAPILPSQTDPQISPFRSEPGHGEAVADGDFSSPEPGGIRRDRVLVKSGACRVADEAGGLHQDVAPPVVRAEAG